MGSYRTISIDWSSREALESFASNEYLLSVEAREDDAREKREKREAARERREKLAREAARD